MTNKEMKFPTHIYSNCHDFFSAYKEALFFGLCSLQTSELEKAFLLIKKVIENNGTIYLCGNGGSAAIANHWACDFLKGTRDGTSIFPKVQSLSSNQSLLTAIGNDIGFDQIFEYQLTSLLTKSDLVILISSSGQSPNIISAGKAAKAVGAQTISLTGFTGGDVRYMTDLNLHVSVHNYGIVEDCHHVIMHILAQFVRLCELNSSAEADIDRMRF